VTYILDEGSLSFRLELLSAASRGVVAQAYCWGFLMIRLHRSHAGAGARSAIDHAEGASPGRLFDVPPTSERLTSAVLDSLTAHVAVLDQAGTILVVNRSWNDFAVANGAHKDVVCMGVNYLGVCDRAVGAGVEEAAAFASGVRDVLDGRIESISNTAWAAPRLCA
jgi:hypothetical protein